MTSWKWHVQAQTRRNSAGVGKSHEFSLLGKEIMIIGVAGREHFFFVIFTVELLCVSTTLQSKPHAQELSVNTKWTNGFYDSLLFLFLRVNKDMNWVARDLEEDLGRFVGRE